MSQTTRELASTLSKLRAQLLTSQKDLLEIQNLQNALSETLDNVWTQQDIQLLPASTQEWKEFSSLVASSRIPSVSAQASEALSQTFDDRKGWLSNGADYSRWLGRGIAELSSRRDLSKPEDFAPIATFCGRAFSIGYTGKLSYGGTP